MTARGTILLWAAVAVLGLYLWSTERPSPGVDETQPRAPLFRFDPNSVDTIDLTHAAGVLQFRRDDVGWRDNNGDRWQAPERLAALIRTVGDLRPLQVIAETSDRLADYGLDPPEYELTLAFGQDPFTVTLALGERNPTWTAVYARTGRPEDGVVLVGFRIVSEIEKITGAAGADRHASPPSGSADRKSENSGGG